MYKRTDLISCAYIFNCFCISVYIYIYIIFSSVSIKSILIIYQLYLYLLHLYMYSYLLHLYQYIRYKIGARKMKRKRKQNDVQTGPQSLKHRWNKSIKQSMRNLRLAPILEPNGFRNGGPNYDKSII